MFEIGKVYNRSADLHSVYGGQRQGGISTPSTHSIIFLFTGESGEHFGYYDGWDDDGIFLFTGEGQQGDMAFVRGNLAIRDHAQSGKSLYLFQSLGKGQGYRHVGEFVCASWEFRNGADVDGQQRKIIVFHLVPVTDVADSKTIALSTSSIDELRTNAYDAATAAISASESDAKRIVYVRSEAVRRYVLARSNGICESCKKPSPFNRTNGTPYLEPHHTRRVSDGGPDHPRWVGAVCPNCHSEIHFGENGQAKNSELEKYLGTQEQQ